MTNRRILARDNRGRRRFLGAVASGATLVLAGYSPIRSEAREKGGSIRADDEKKISPGEDLMREHGALKRILLVYEEAVHWIETNKDLPPEALISSAGIIRSFIEDYHEKLEENFLFPRFRKAGRLVDLVDVLQEQHKAGRRLTEERCGWPHLRRRKTRKLVAS
jgi:hypothetical protein